MKNFKRVLSVLLVVMMVATMIVPAMAAETEATPYVTSHGATMTVHELHNIKDFFIAEGTYATYREMKNAGYLFNATAKKLAGATEYSYVVTHGGAHTVVIRYNDGSQAILYHNIEVIDPEFSVNGLQITVSNLDEVRMIRTAYGAHDSIKSIKATEGFRNFSNKTEIKDRDPYTIQYREEGLVTIVVEYTHGYKVFYQHNITKHTPTFVQGDNFVKFGNLDNLVMVRYAAGEYSHVSEIKAAGSTVLKSDAIDENGYITISDLPVNTYTFCVQYNDESYNYYVVHINVKQWTITFDTDGGTMDAGFKTSYGINTGDYYKDVFGGAYPTASMDGYEFKGWYLEKYNFTLTEGDVMGDGYYAVSEDCTLVALWEEAAPALGSYENPYLINVGDTRLAVAIPAGEGVYVKANDSNNSVLTVGYATAATYTISYLPGQVIEVAEDGTSTFTMIADKDFFYVGNNGEEDIVLYMALAEGEAVDTTGTMENPEVLTFATNMWGGVGASAGYTFEAGNSGRWYTVTAPADGQVVFSMQGAVDADYNNIGWQYNVQNLTAGKYGDNHWSDDETVVYDEAWTVSEGDQLLIFVTTYNPDDMWNSPAGTVNFQLAFNAVGSYDLPIVLEEAGTQLVTVEAGSQGTYYTYVAPAAGTVEVIMYSESWQYCVNNLTAGKYGDTHWSNDEEPVTCETLTVAEGDELQIMVNTYDPADQWTAPAGTLSWELAFYAGSSTDEPVLGSFDLPYNLYVGGTALEITVPAGGEAYVSVDDDNNSTVDVVSSNGAWVIYYGRQTVINPAEDGTASFNMVSGGNYFCVTNPTEADITISMTLTAGEAVDNAGTMENPEVLTLAANMWGGVGASASYTFEAGNQGRYYKVVAPADGEIVFNMQGAVDADYNNIGWFYFVNNVTAGKYGDNHWSDDAEPVYNEEWTVSAGDELVVFVSPYDPADQWNNPAGTVSFQLNFNAVGSYDNPLTVEAGMHTATVEEGSQGMYYTYVAPEAGTVEVIMYSESWQYVVNNLTAGTYGDTHWSNDAEPVTCETVAVEAGSELQIMVNTYNPDEEWNAPAGEVNWELAFYAGATTEPEEAELGAYENPYIVNAGDTRVAAYIPAGATVYVKATDANNSTFTLGYATAATYEIYYLRVLYTANTESGNNDTSFTMVSDVDTFGITNTGEEAITVYMALTAGEAADTTGTMDDPEVLEFATNMWGGVGASGSYTFEAANSGRYYKVVAPADGQVVFSMQGAVDADYNNIGWQYNVQNLTAGKYGDNHWSDDETVVYDEVWTVSAGDELLIFVTTYNPDDMWNSPAGTVNFQLAFNAVGSCDYPVAVTDDGVYTAAVAAGSQGMYYTYTAAAAGTLTVQMLGTEGWTYVVNNTTAGTYGDTHWSNDETLVAYETINVAAGDVVSIMVNTFNPDDQWNAPAGEVAWSLNFTAEGKAWTITLDADGGVLNAPTTYSCNTGDTYADIFGGFYPTATLEGYTFGGWYLEKYNFTLTEGDVTNGGYYAVSEDCTLVALWTEA